MGQAAVEALSRVSREHCENVTTGEIQLDCVASTSRVSVQVTG
jgi:hypothetical protein